MQQRQHNMGMPGYWKWGNAAGENGMVGYLKCRKQPVNSEELFLYLQPRSIPVSDEVVMMAYLYFADKFLNDFQSFGNLHTSGT